MKRAVKAFIAVYFTVIMCFMGGMTAFAWNVDTLRQSITLKNAPDGTAFADILVKDKKNDKYAVDFNDENGKLLGVDKDCGLAKYEEGGYTSMLLRHNCAVFEKSDMENMYVVFGLKEENDEIFNHFSQVKVAYCDKDGNILGVTNASAFETVHFFNTPAAYNIETNGEGIYCRVSTGPPYFMMLVVPVLVLVPSLGIALGVIAKKLRKKAQTAKMIKRIQSGEVDNERKEQ